MSLVRHWLLAAAFIVGLATPAFAQDAPLQIKGAITVDAQQIFDLLKKHPNLVILDNRKVEDFADGHIEGATRLIDTDVTPDSLAYYIASHDTPVLFYCNGVKCGRAAKATEKAVQLGYKVVYYYALGMDEWKRNELPLVK
jgi:rhodanese-related sulfurtransferase